MIWMLGGIVLAGMTACSRDDDEATKVPDSITKVSNDSVKVRRLTITEMDNGAAARQALTRATLTEGDGLTASWRAGDVLSYCNLSYPWDEIGLEKPYSGPLTAASTAATSQFTGDVECRVNDNLAVVYPATTFKTDESYTISLTGQDGTLATLASTFHYVYGLAHVISVTDHTAEATMVKMKSLLTVCKFSFVDQATSLAIPIQTLTISYGGDGQSDAGTYPQSATVAISDDTAPENVHASGVTGSTPLTITATGQTEVFVALLPTAAKRTFIFTVTNGSGTYTGSAKAWLKEGEYVVATGLELTKQ